MKYILLMLTVISFSGCAVVGPGQKGIHTVFGKPTSETNSGLTLWVPIVYGLTKFDLRVQKHVIETTAASKDMQPLETHVALNWRIDPTNLLGFYKDVGDEDDAVQKILQPAVNEVVKAATSKLTAEEIISRRIELKTEIDANLQKRLERYGLHCDDVSIMDVSFSQDFTKAIEAKQIAEQKAKQAEYDSLTAVQVAKSAVNKARGEAEANVMLAKAQAQSQQLLRSTLTKDILQLEYLKKWSGELPKVMVGNSAGMILDLKTLNETTKNNK